jgi:alpha-galactosidase
MFSQEFCLLSRRAFVGSSLAATVAVAPPFSIAAPAQKTSTFVDLLRVPDSATAYAGLQQRIPLEKSGERFGARNIAVEFAVQKSGLDAHLVSPDLPLTHVHARWRAKISEGLLCFGDDWERSYGTLCWQDMVPERVMPWYFATHDGVCVHGYGVKTGAAALCFWQFDPEGVSLWMNVSNGGEGVELGQRKLHLATVVSRKGQEGEGPLVALRALCRQMCPVTRPSQRALWGVNDWYYAYGHNSAQMLLEMTDIAVNLAPAGGPKPFTVVDDGWRDGSATFPSMADFASSVRKKGARPGIWIRPLIASSDPQPELLLSAGRFGDHTQRARETAFDPTIPEAMDRVIAKVKQVASWGFELIKHDYSTYDLLGKWGNEMGASPTHPGWRLHDRTRTNAEVIRDLYESIRRASGDRIQIIGCNTVGHLSAGLFEMQRTGDDTSGKDWERTRRMGVNTLAHRLCQHGTFFQLDADCVALTKDVAWSLTRQWLDVVARSKTVLFVSPDPSVVGPEQKNALKEAFAELASSGGAAEPADLFHGTTPEIWRAGESQREYAWSGPEGASPFPLG